MKDVGIYLLLILVGAVMGIALADRDACTPPPLNATTIEKGDRL